MNIALIDKNTGACLNVAVFSDLEAAQEMLGRQYTLTEAQEGYGIGDTFRDGVWAKAEVPAPQPSPEEETALLKAQVQALSNSQEFLEDCLIEMGQIVYA